mgnify:CR=1 FL=1
MSARTPAGTQAEARKAAARERFEGLRDRICASLEALEDEVALNPAALPAGRFERKAWLREGGGGGIMGLLTEGRLFEKAGVNVSTVWGQFQPQFAKEIHGAGEDPSFWASGLSLVIHPRNPRVPPIHMNTRHIVTAKSWFGGGIDLNPIVSTSSLGAYGGIRLAHPVGDIRIGTNLEVAFFDQLRGALREDWNALDNVSEGREFIEINTNADIRECYPGQLIFASSGGGEYYALNTTVTPPRYAMVPTIGGPDDALDQGPSLNHLLERLEQGRLFDEPPGEDRVAKAVARVIRFAPDLEPLRLTYTIGSR